MPPPPIVDSFRADLPSDMTGILEKSVSYAAGRLRELAPRDVSVSDILSPQLLSSADDHSLQS